MACPDPEQLLAFVAGGLPAAEVAVLERHMDRCPGCRRIVASLAKATPSSDTAPTQPMAEPPRHDEGYLPGQLVDHFVVVAGLGQGGMGRVYLARDIRLGRKVALKVLGTSLASETEREWFLREAQTTATFNHPNIVTIYDIGEHEGHPYLALEHIEGQTLHQRAAEQGYIFPEVLRIGEAVSRALEEAHRRQIVHGDLKPSNVMMARDGRICVLDFGLARAAAGAAGAGGETEWACGTPYYMAPELWRRQQATEAVDIWALGVVLYELLAGRRPYHAERVRDLGRQIVDPAPVPPVHEHLSLPAELSQLVGRCLEKDPAARPRAADLVGQFRRLLLGDARQLAQEESPFRGLLPFDERHHHLFFGRDEEVSAFVDRLRLEPVLAVVGPSGTGKSSFVHAGVIPRLRERGPLVVIRLRPGRQPFVNLAHQLAALPRSGAGSGGVTPFGSIAAAVAVSTPSAPQGEGPTGLQDEAAELARKLEAAPELLNLQLQRLSARHRASVLLFVDQLEELCTLVSDVEWQQKFMAAICTAADEPGAPVRVVLTLREEFLTRLANGPEARSALGHVVVLRTPDATALKEILTRPVEALGFRYDAPRVVDEMIAEVRGETACLPLLQFSGQVLWRQRDRDRHLLLRSAYEEMGGVAGALAQHADGLLAGLTGEEVDLVRAILLRLVGPGGTRRVLPRSRALEGLGGRVDPVLERLLESRLVVAVRSEPDQEPDLELVHESLTTGWSRLRRWLEESREELVFLEELERAAELWSQRGRRDAEVWPEESLRDAQRLLASCTTEPSGQAREFLAAGQRKRRQRTWRKRLLVGGAFALLAAVAVIYAFKEQETRREKERAERLGVEALQEGARAAWLRGDPLEARAKLRSALEAGDSAQARALWGQLESEALTWTRSFGALLQGVTFTPEGGRLVLACSDRSVYVLDARTSATLQIFRGHSDQVFGVAVSPDGKRLVSSSWNGEVRLWGLDGGERRLLREPDGGAILSVAFAPDGRTIAASSEDGAVRLWQGSSRQPRELRGHQGRVYRVSFHPDGKRLASAGRDGTVRLWEIKTGREIRVIGGQGQPIRGVAFSPDGRTLATAGYDLTVRLWDVASGRQIEVLAGHTAPPYVVRFSPNGRWLASAGEDRVIRLWELGGEARRFAFRGPTDRVFDVAFGPDGQTVAAASGDRAARLWSLRRTAGTPAVPGPRQYLDHVTWSPDGRTVVSSGTEGLLIWDAQSGRRRRLVQGHDGGVLSSAFSPDGRTLVSSSWDKTLRLWDTRSWRSLKVLRGHRFMVRVVRYSPDGRLLASASSDKTVRVWDAETGQQLHVLAGHQAEIRDLAFSPDGRQLASASYDKTIRVWGLDPAQPIRVLVGHEAPAFAVVFLHDGKSLVSASADHTVRRWDLTGKGGGTHRILTRGTERISKLALSPDGRTLALSSPNGPITLWDLRLGRATRVLRGHRAEIDGLAFSPDGRRLASASTDQSVRVWQVAEGRPFWRAPLMTADPPELASHLGWTRLDRDAPPRALRGEWQRVVERRGWLGSLGPGGLLCLATVDGMLEIWDTGNDRRLALAKMELEEVRAIRGACVVRTRGGAVQLIRPAGAPVVLAERGASALAVDDDAILVSTGAVVRSFSHDGRPGRERHPSEPAVTALLRRGNGLLLGFRDGNVQGGALAFAETPSSAVLRMIPGPMDTVIVGFANGVLGIWNPATGRRLDGLHLHGAVVHLQLKGDRLYAATELGDHQVWDLGVLRRGYCDVLRQVWLRVPVVWRDGMPTVAPAPAKHRCRPR